jgi:hypothetical protein
MNKFARVDANQKEIVKGLRDYGAEVFHVYMVKNLFDILVAFNGQLFCMEIKDPKKPPSARKLTEGEERCKVKLNGVGVDYHVVTTLPQAIQIITNESN